MAAYDNQALTWDSEIEHDGEGRFVLLPEGNYPFTVSDFKRGEHKGSAKIPPCLKAIVTCQVDGGEKGMASVDVNLFLHKNAEWKLCEFFRSIGARRHGEKLRMDWNNIVGKGGMCRVSVREWKGDDDMMRKSNDIEQFIDPPAQPANKGSWNF